MAKMNLKGFKKADLDQVTGGGIRIPKCVTPDLTLCYYYYVVATLQAADSGDVLIVGKA